MNCLFLAHGGVAGEGGRGRDVRSPERRERRAPALVDVGVPDRGLPPDTKYTTEQEPKSADNIPESAVFPEVSSVSSDEYEGRTSMGRRMASGEGGRGGGGEWNLHLPPKVDNIRFPPLLLHLDTKAPPGKDEARRADYLEHPVQARPQSLRRSLLGGPPSRPGDGKDSREAAEGRDPENGGAEELDRVRDVSQGWIGAVPAPALRAEGFG